MFVLVVGGGKVGYYLTKELSESGHEVVLMEKDRGRADQIADEIGSIVVAKDGCEGSALAEAGREPRRRRRGGHRRRRGQPRHLPDGEASLRRPQDDRPGQQPEERAALQAPRRRRADLADADDPGLDRAGHPGPRAAPPGPAVGRLRADRGAPRRGARRRSAATRATSSCPDGCAIVAIVRDDVAQAIRADTVLRAGDKVIATGRPECEPALHEIAHRRRRG